MAEKLTELAKRLRPFLLGVGQSVVTQLLNAAEGPGIDIPVGTNVIGIGGDSILLFFANGDPAQEFAVTDAGLDLASAAASSGDVVYIPVCTLTADHTFTDGVAYVGAGRNKTIITGQVTMGPASPINLSVIRTANDSSDLIALAITTYQSPTIYFCDFVATQNGSGDAYGVKVAAGAGQPHFEYCHIDGQSVGGDGYGYYQDD